MKLDVLAIAAHPDDTELSCAGTLAALVKQGKRVGVLDLTRGEMGTRGTPETRLQEAADAAEILGLAVRHNLSLPDAGLTNTDEHRRAIVQAVRTYQPDLCFINSPDDRHPDHGNAARLTLDALFYSGLQKIETTDEHGKPQETWRPSHILHYMQDRTFTPNIVFDISDTIELKEKAILAFSSQFNVDNPGEEPETYISSNRFFENLRARSAHFGHMIGVKYGEPFLYHGGPIPATALDFLLNHKQVR
ncbi:MAG: bacillithiol biosynthesis deacetylase BshB1 [Bacteroidetes bacterium]|nr:bacillithiol biosynthesis deacetylase BshB1 [Bacteroidota bacterium]MCH8523765.1 bacillithiol biosynthesis deacetylase BshB1 [Balneolales bacterium]